MTLRSPSNNLFATSLSLPSVAAIERVQEKKCAEEKFLVKAEKIKSFYVMKIFCSISRRLAGWFAS